MYLIAKEYYAVLDRHQQADYIKEIQEQEALELEAFLLRQRLFSVVKNIYST